MPADILGGRVAIVTGASRGIGAAVADRLEGAGARVVRLARSLTAARGNRRWDIPCDLTEAGAAAAAAHVIVGRWGAPRILVNNAGAFLLRPFAETDPAQLDVLLALNLRAPFAMTRALVPAMLKAGDGVVVTVGSVSDHTAFPDNAAYTAAKFGLRGLHEALVAEYRGSGLRFSMVSPGPTDTSVWDPVDPDNRPGFVRRADMLRPADVADAILFVATRPAAVQIDWLRLGPAPVTE